MKFLFVSRKKHERIVEDFKNNNKIINDERQRVTEKNIELQKVVRKLQKELEIKEEINNRYSRTIDELVVERDNAIRIQRSETRTRKSKKYKEMEKIIETVKKENEELVDDLDRTRKELDEALTKILQAEKECNCNCDHDENTEEITVFKKGFDLTDEELAEKLNEAMRTEFPELPFTDIEPPIKTEVKEGVIRPVKKQPKNKGKRVNKANKNSKMNNRRKGSK